ncbi:hypothetical protein Tco_0028056, partial [Tanacetum coccineum]
CDLGHHLSLFNVDGLHSTWSFCNVVFSIFVSCVMIDHYVAFPSFRHCRGVTSCIEQFWSTGMVKTINGEVQLNALVDGKKIIIFEAFVRRDLKLEDEEGIDCLSNSTIFEQLALMGYEKISQKLTFYKPFFSP